VAGLHASPCEDLLGEQKLSSISTVVSKARPLMLALHRAPSSERRGAVGRPEEIKVDELRHPGPNAAAEWDRGPRVGSTIGRARLHNRRKGSRVPDFLGIGLITRVGSDSSVLH